MAVLNPDNNDNSMGDSNTDPSTSADLSNSQQAPTGGGGDPKQALSEGSNLLRDANDLLHSVNDLLQNPVVQKKNRK